MTMQNPPISNPIALAQAEIFGRIDDLERMVSDISWADGAKDFPLIAREVRKRDKARTALSGMRSEARKTFGLLSDITGLTMETTAGGITRVSSPAPVKAQRRKAARTPASAQFVLNHSAGAAWGRTAGTQMVLLAGSALEPQARPTSLISGRQLRHRQEFMASDAVEMRDDKAILTRDTVFRTPALAVFMADGRRSMARFWQSVRTGQPMSSPWGHSREFKECASLAVRARFSDLVCQNMTMFSSDTRRILLAFSQMSGSTSEMSRYVLEQGKLQWAAEATGHGHVYLVAPDMSAIVLSARELLKRGATGFVTTSANGYEYKRLPLSVWMDEDGGQLKTVTIAGQEEALNFFRVRIEDMI